MMTIRKIETMVGNWLRPVPHLPKAAEKWIAENSWWIVLVGTIASAISILVGIGAIFTYMAFVGNAASYYGFYTASPYGPGWIVGSVVSLLFSTLVVILLATAITPLKAMQRKGWDRLFLVLLIDVASVVIGSILSFSIFGFVIGLIFGAIGVAISAYFLYEIQSYFGASHKVVSKHAAKS
jgi:hypothetical protein